MDGLGAGSGSASLSYSHDIDATVGVGYRRSSIDSPMDLFTLSQTLASLGVSLYPAGLPPLRLGMAATGLFSISIPSPFAHQVLQIGLKTSYVSLNETFYQITNPRGAFDSVVQTMPRKGAPLPGLSHSHCAARCAAGVQSRPRGGGLWLSP